MLAPWSCIGGSPSKRISSDMARRRGQDELTRRRRLNEGNCPTHGIPLHQDVPYASGGLVYARFYCPRRDCVFQQHYEEGSKVWKAAAGD